MKLTAQSLLYGTLGVCVSAFFTAGCKPQENVAVSHVPEAVAVDASLDDFKGQPTEENLRKVEAALAGMKAEISELAARASGSTGAEKSESEARLEDLRVKYAGYQAEFAAARVGSAVGNAGRAAEQALEKAGEAARDASQAMERNFKSEDSDSKSQNGKGG